MGRLSDFIDKETEKRNRRTDEKLQPFMQQMDLLIKTKEKQEVKEQTDTYYTGKFKDVGGTYDPKSLNPEDDLKRAMEFNDDKNFSLSKGYVTEEDLKGKTRDEQSAIIKANQPGTAPKERTYDSGGFEIRERWDGFKWVEIGRNKIIPKTTTKEREITLINKKTGEQVSAYTKDGKVFSIKTNKEITDPDEYSEKVTASKESMQDKAQREGFGHEWDTSTKIDPQEQYADAKARYNKRIKKEKELESYKKQNVINYADPIAKDDAVKMGKSWLALKTEPSKKRLSDLNAGKIVMYKKEVYVKIKDTVYKFKDSEEHSALQLATKFSKEYPEKIKQLEKEIEEMKGVGGEEMKSGKKKKKDKTIKTITTKTEYDALQSGTEYLLDGVKARKP